MQETYLPIEAKEVQKRLPYRQEDAHKGTFGEVLVVAGSFGMAGAAYLCALAAYKSGVGLVRIYTPQENREILQILLPEAVLLPYSPKERELAPLQKAVHKATHIVLGPGLGVSPCTEAIVAQVLMAAKAPLILDADALNTVSLHPDFLDLYQGAALILTPHIKEMGRLCQRPPAWVQAHPKEAAGGFLQEKRILVLKDAHTLIFTESGRPYRITEATSALAKGGSGDVLAGVIAGLMASGASPTDAAVAGVYLHNAAGRRLAAEGGTFGVLARDVANEIPRVIAAVAEKKTVNQRKDQNGNL